MYGLLQAKGDAVILLVADLQDPPELMREFVKNWLAGAPIVIGVKPEAKESALFFALRRMYYRLVTRIANVKLIQNFTGFGLYDRKVIEILRQIDDPYPYFRGLVCEIGFDVIQLPYVQPRRKRGISKNNFYTLYDIAMLGITSHSKVPLRLATIAGFFLSGVSFAFRSFIWCSSCCTGTAFQWAAHRCSSVCFSSRLFSCFLSACWASTLARF